MGKHTDERYATLSRSMGETVVGSYDLDKKIWGVMRGHGEDIPYYDVEVFEQARAEGDPKTRMSTNVAAAMEVIQEEMPTVRISIQTAPARDGEGTICRCDMGYSEHGVAISAVTRSRSGPHGVAVAVCAAYADIFPSLVGLRHDAMEIEDDMNAAGPMSGWPIVQDEAGAWRSVSDKGFASQGWRSREKAEEYAAITRWNFPVAMKSRERYEAMREAGFAQDQAPSP